MIFPQAVENSEFSEFSELFSRRELRFWEVFASVFSYSPGVFHRGDVFFEVPQAKESRGGGEEKHDFLRSKNVALCLFTSKAMAVLRWSSSPREQLNYNYICIAKNLNFTCLFFPTANFIIFSHPPPLIRALRKLRAKTKWDSENFKPKRTAI